MLMLYLPKGNHRGGSFEPARVASSWVLTPPTQSYPPPLLWLGSPPLCREDGVPGWNVSLRKLPGCSPTVGLSLSPGLRQPGGGVPGQPQTLWGVRCDDKEERKVQILIVTMSNMPPLLGYSVRMPLETWSPILGKYCCCLFTPVQSERRSSKVAELLFLAHQRPRSWLAGILNPARSSAQRLDVVQNFQPIRDAALRDRGADWKRSETMSAVQNLTINVSKFSKIFSEGKSSNRKITNEPQLFWVIIFILLVFYFKHILAPIVSGFYD